MRTRLVSYIKPVAGGHAHIWILVLNLKQTKLFASSEVPIFQVFSDKHTEKSAGSDGHMREVMDDLVCLSPSSSFLPIAITFHACHIVFGIRNGRLMDTGSGC